MAGGLWTIKPVILKTIYHWVNVIFGHAPLTSTIFPNHAYLHHFVAEYKLSQMLLVYFGQNPLKAIKFPCIIVIKKLKLS